MEQIAKALWEVMSVLGIPKIMQSDNGSEFVNQVIDELVQLNGIDHMTISAYNPRVHGQVERVNQVIDSILKKELENAMHEWPDYVPFAQLSYNAKISTTTGSTPFSLMFGRRLNDFEEYGSSRVGTDMRVKLWRKRQDEITNVVYPAVKERVLKKKEKMVRDFAKRHRILKTDTLPKGSVVMMIDKTQESKWDPKYEGPFVVVRKNRGGAYVLKDRLRETLKRTVPVDQLKLISRHEDDAVIQVPSFEVKKVTNHRYNAKKKLEYYVEWKDPKLIPGWEPVENFDDVNIIKQYWKQVRPQRKRKPKKKV